jgi:hypothetical protein
VQRLEGELGALRLDEQRLQEQLAINQVVSKKDFFAQLDLLTFEGRHAANSLLKRLGVLVSVSVHALYQFYSVRVEECHRFQLVHTGNGIMMLTADKAILDLRVLQGEISPAERDSWLRVIELKSNGQLSVAIDKLKSIDLSKMKFKGLPESMVKALAKTR